MVSGNVDHIHRRDLYSAARRSRRNGLITIWCDMESLACAESLRRAGLSAAAETLVHFKILVHTCTQRWCKMPVIQQAMKVPVMHSMNITNSGVKVMFYGQGTYRYIYTHSHRLF